MTTKNILVTGDFVIDHHIYEGHRHHYGDRIEDGVRLEPELGGAALIQRLLTTMLGDKKDRPFLPAEWRSHLAVEDPTLAQSGGGAAAAAEGDKAYAFWRPFPKDGPTEKQYWRVSEAMGFGASDGGPSSTWNRTTPPAPDIAIVSDGGVNFRSPSRIWGSDQFAKAQWVVLKAAAPVMSGTTWNSLAKLSSKLVVVVAARELRKSPVRIGEGLSWEDSIQDLIRGFAPGGGMEALTQCRHLIVSFDTEGAVWFDFERANREPASGLTDSTRVHFVYDASAIEGEHARVLRGDAHGVQSCLVAAIVRELALNPDTPAMTEGLDRGLCAMRDLREHGHGRASERPDGFPAQRLASAVDQRPYVYSRAMFSAGEAGANGWNLIQQSQRTAGPVYDLARLVLLRGPIGLANVPHVRVGDYLTPDRHEIEALRGLIQLVQRYAKGAASKPLSMGVFGPPGAGKSFAVKQMVNIVPGAKWLEFNLSQFNNPRELIGAFHQIRDHVLEGKLPLAFFDEFDSQGYVWLKHLLAPMQDGRFQDGQLSHPIGKCVMVFAGGTSWTYDSLGPPPADPGVEEPALLRDFRMAKGPDFKSRLDGYLDVVGPNRRQTLVAASAKPSPTAEHFAGRWFDADAGDIHFPVRRALMIRSELKCGPDEKLDIDEGLVHALLRTHRYTHGSRSLGKVAQPLAAHRGSPLTRSMLPPATQLKLHVDATAFMDICRAAPPLVPPWRDLPQGQLDVMARAMHDNYREQARAGGWSIRPEVDRDFDDLDDFYKNSNRAAANRMAEILPLAGLRLEQGSAAAAEEDEVRTRLEYSLEALAEAEHDGWTAWHFSQGWRYDAKRDPGRKRHNCLRPYLQLSKQETDKDREAIREYPDVARRGGMKIVFAQPA